MRSGGSAPVALLLLASSFPVFAQQSSPIGPGTSSIPGQLPRLFDIGGMVRLASTFQAAERARVTLERFTGETVAVMESDWNGNFSFASVPAGEYVIIAYAPGFLEARLSVVVRMAPARGVIITLRPDPSAPVTSLATSVSVQELALPPKAQRELEKGFKALAESDYQASQNHFGKVLEADPKFAGAHYGLGASLYSQNKYEQAEAELRKAIELDESVALPYVLLGHLLNDRQRYQEAELLLHAAAERFPNRSGVFYELARASWARGNVTTSEAHLRRAHSLEGCSPRVHLLLSNVLVVKGDLAGARQEMEEYLTIEPRGARADEVRSKLGLLKAELEKEKRAENERLDRPASPPPP